MDRSIGAGYISTGGNVVHAFDKGSMVSLCGYVTAPGARHHDPAEKPITCENCLRTLDVRASMDGYFADVKAHAASQLRPR